MPYADGARPVWGRYNRAHHPLLVPSGTPFAAVVFEIPYEFLLLGINRDDRLIRRHKRLGLIADVLKLCVPVHVTASFPCLTVGLQTVPKFAQTVGNHVRSKPNALFPDPAKPVTSVANFSTSNASVPLDPRALPAPPNAQDRTTTWNLRPVSPSGHRHAGGSARPPVDASPRSPLSRGRSCSGRSR